MRFQSNTRTIVGFVALIVFINLCIILSTTDFVANILCPSNFLSAEEKSSGWILLFDGQTLNRWKPSTSPSTFVVRNGMIVAQGLAEGNNGRDPHSKCHLFYSGNDGNASFKDFEFHVDIKSEEHTNSGIYFHTEFIENIWPQKGFEIQIDNDPTHAKKTGSLYDVVDITESPAKDNEWVHLNVVVQGRRIVVKLNGQTVVDWNEPENFLASNPPSYSERKLSCGTFALQCHGSENSVYFRNIRVKPLSPLQQASDSRDSQR